MLQTQSQDPSLDNLIQMNGEARIVEAVIHKIGPWTGLKQNRMDFLIVDKKVSLVVRVFKNSNSIAVDELIVGKAYNMKLKTDKSYRNELVAYFTNEKILEQKKSSELEEWYNKNYQTFSIDHTSFPSKLKKIDVDLGRINLTGRILMQSRAKNRAVYTITDGRDNINVIRWNESEDDVFNDGTIIHVRNVKVDSYQDREQFTIDELSDIISSQQCTSEFSSQSLMKRSCSPGTSSSKKMAKIAKTQTIDIVQQDYNTLNENTKKKAMKDIMSLIKGESIANEYLFTYIQKHNATSQELHRVLFSVFEKIDHNKNQEEFFQVLQHIATNMENSRNRRIFEQSLTNTIFKYVLEEDDDCTNTDEAAKNVTTVSTVPENMDVTESKSK